MTWLRTCAPGARRKHPIEVYHAARPYLVAALARDLDQPLLILTARGNRARQWVDELRIWLPDEVPVHNFADPDALPYERIPWAPETRQRRLEGLVSLLTWEGGGCGEAAKRVANQRSGEAANQRIATHADDATRNHASRSPRRRFRPRAHADDSACA